MSMLAGNHLDVTGLLVVARLHDNDGGPGPAGPARLRLRPPRPGARAEASAAKDALLLTLGPRISGGQLNPAAARPPAPGGTQITAAAPCHPGQQLTPALMGIC